ncbi:MAG: PepSY domain-containing protein [Oscillospiraceae bacterium]
MNNTDVETRLARALAHTAPDALNAILSECEERKGKVIEMKAKTTHKKAWVNTICATAAALALFIGGGFGISHFQTAHAVDTTVSLDVNPSIKIEANKNEIVLSVSALNEDGTTVLEDKKFEGKDLQVAVDEIVKAMVEKGYLSADANSVLLAVNNPDDTKSAQLQKQLSESVSKALSEKGIEGAILSHGAPKGEEISRELAALAEKYGISESKAELIKGLNSNNPDLKLEELSKLNINDLSLLAEKFSNKLPGLSMDGKPSDVKYVEAKAAIEKVLEQVKTATKNPQVKFNSNLEYSDGKLVFEVKLETGETDYSYIIDAVSGKVIKVISQLTGKAPEVPEALPSPAPAAPAPTPEAGIPTASVPTPALPQLPQGGSSPDISKLPALPGLTEVNRDEAQEKLQGLVTEGLKKLEEQLVAKSAK